MKSAISFGVNRELDPSNPQQINEDNIRVSSLLGSPTVVSGKNRAKQQDYLE